MINTSVCQVTYLRGGYAIASTQENLPCGEATLTIKSAFQYIYRELSQIVILEVK